MPSDLLFAGHVFLWGCGAESPQRDVFSFWSCSGLGGWQGTCNLLDFEPHQGRLA